MQSPEHEYILAQIWNFPPRCQKPSDRGYTKRMRHACALVLFFALAGTASAAGFAKHSLFLSRGSVVLGDSVIVYALVANEATSTFDGVIVFSDGDEQIGSVSTTLKAGEARIASVSWTPSAAGARALTASLRSGDSVIEEQSETFSVAAPAKKTGTSAAAAIQTSHSIQEKIGGVSPQAAQIVEPIFETVDGWRQTASDVLYGQIAKAKGNLPGNVLGLQTYKPDDENNPSSYSPWAILWTLYFYALTILNFLLVSAVIFYPLLAILFIYILWKLFQRMSGRSYTY